jgi:redox-sensitive bicupin YhaK (pirin superfamily)
MRVSRTLPLRELPTIGAWCFLDRFGPQETVMRVEPHPHTGLQTVTWPLAGDVRHRDSLGSDVVLKPGQLNLMTSGRGVAHSEYSLGEGPAMLDALQLWVALPVSAREMSPAFASHPVLPTMTIDDARATVVLGEFSGVRSPAKVHSPIVGAQVEIGRGGVARLPLHPAWEHAVVLLKGDVSVTGVDAPQDALMYFAPGRASISLASQGGAMLFLLGGEPFPDPLVMWWNFVGGSHEEIASARDAWEAGEPRFGEVPGHGDVRIPAPPLPSIRLWPRSRR